MDNLNMQGGEKGKSDLDYIKYVRETGMYFSVIRDYSVFFTIQSYIFGLESDYQ